MTLETKPELRLVHYSCKTSASSEVLEYSLRIILVHEAFTSVGFCFNHRRPVRLAVELLPLDRAN